MAQPASNSTAGKTRVQTRHVLAAAMCLVLVMLAVRALPYVRFRLPAPPPVPGTVLRGALHVHTPATEKLFEATLEAARERDLDFVLFSGPSLDGSADGREGYYTLKGAAGGTDKPILVLFGLEIPTDRGPLLVVGRDPLLSLPPTRRASRLIAAARQVGALTIALAPCTAPVPVDAHPAPAPPDPPPGVQAVEGISLAADFGGDRYYPLMAAALISSANEAGGIASLARTRDTPGEPGGLPAWSAGRGVVGGVGLEPGDGRYPGRPRPQVALAWVTTHLRVETPPARIAGSFGADRDALLDALAAGRTRAVVEAFGSDLPPGDRGITLVPRSRAGLPGDGWVLRSMSSAGAGG